MSSKVYFQPISNADTSPDDKFKHEIASFIMRNDIDGFNEFLSQINKNDINPKKNLWRAIIVAVQKKRILMVEKLLAYGADPNAHDKVNHTLLHRACENGSNDIVKLLIYHNPPALINVVDQKKLTPLYYACFKGHAHIVRELLAYVPTLSQVKNEESNKQKQEQESESNNNNNNNNEEEEKNKNNNNPNNQLNSLLMLCNINLGTPSPLYAAVDKGHLEVVKLLLNQRNIQIDLSDDKGHTPLLRAIAGSSKEHVEMIKLLLNPKYGKPANINIISDGGWTPMMWATHRPNNEACKLLLSCPQMCELWHVDSDEYKTAFELANKNIDKEYVKIMKHQLITQITSALREISKFVPLEIIDKIIEWTY